MKSDLAILNAEQFDDGVRVSSGKAARSADNGLNPRKRAKTQPSSGTEKEEEEKKRTRGRPRLDTRDETAADVSVAVVLLTCFQSFTDSLCPCPA